MKRHLYGEQGDTTAIGGKVKFLAAASLLGAGEGPPAGCFSLTLPLGSRSMSRTI